MYNRKTTKYLKSLSIIIKSTILLLIMTLLSSYFYQNSCSRIFKSTVRAVDHQLQGEMLNEEEIPSTIVDDNINLNLYNDDSDNNNFIIKSSEDKTTEENKSQDLVHIVEYGDNFWNLSIKYYGDGYYCIGLKKYNNIESLKIGDRLAIPDKSNEDFITICEKANSDAQNNNKVVSLENTVSKYTYGHRVTPAVNISIPTNSDMKNDTSNVDTSNYELLGSYKITGYTPGCTHCCGGNATGIGASGVQMIPGYSVAMKGLDFGTTIYIEGYGYYVVEDRGVGSGVVDIACPDHDSCGPVTARGINVYIVK